MKNSTRGALWSALVFPGSGQIVLSHWKRAIPFALFNAVCIIFLIVSVSRGTWTGMEQEALQGADITLSTMLSVAFASLESAKNYILPMMFICWALSVIDAWMLGRRLL